MREEIIGDCRLILGDCREVLCGLPVHDALVTDPPYGIGADSTMAKQGGTKYGNAAAKKRNYAATDWDRAAPDAPLMDLALSAAKWQIIFGGNYFFLPPARCWLVWDKENGSNEFADAELAWTNLDKPVRLKRWMWNGMLRRGQEERGAHPTQKPLGVMQWCLGHLPVGARSVVDPFMGSGTTGVACALEDRPFTGVELEPSYFDIACRRIEEAYRQPRLFAEPVAKPVQETLAL
jgi:DNA modification methylase